MTQASVRRDVPLPTFIIIGAMRSGTTSLARYLGAHPQVFMLPQKEIHFFDRRFHEGLDWYAREFSRVAGEREIGESTPAYMYEELAIKRMASVLPDSRLIAILRNPVDRAYSHYWHNRARRREHLEFEEAISAESDRLLSTNDMGLRARYSYLERGRYHGQLVKVCKYYPRDALRVLIFEEMLADPVGTYRQVCGFLGVDEDFLPPNLGAPIGRFVTFRSPALRDATRGFPPFLRNAIGRLNSRSGDYPPMERELRGELQRRFEKENAELATWLGRDLEVWNC